MTKTVQLTLDETLLERIDRATQALGIPRSDFIRQAVEISLQNMAISELERRHRKGYKQHPIKPGEFDVWEAEQAWGEA
jgi:metal-responsive CopG/Arc/MetJ family transcriptional regulator